MTTKQKFSATIICKHFPANKDYVNHYILYLPNGRSISCDTADDALCKARDLHYNVRFVKENRPPLPIYITDEDLGIT